MVAIALPVLFQFVPLAQASQTVEDEPSKPEVRTTTSLTEVNKNLGPYGQYEATVNYLKRPADMEKDQRALLFHYDQQTSLQPDAKYTIKAVRVTIKNPANQSEVVLYLVDQTKDGQLDSVGLAESFDGGKTFTDIGFVYLFRSADADPAKAKRIEYLPNISEKKVRLSNGQLVSEQPLPKDDPRIKDLVNRINWLWGRATQP